MPKVSKKRKKAPSKYQDLLLATILGVVVVAVGLVVTRYSEASTQQPNSFNRDPITQMTGGSVVQKSGQKVRLASSPAPGVNPVVTLVSKEDMAKTGSVCVDYTVKQAGTFINVTYNSPAGGLATSPGAQKSSGSWTECVVTNGKAVAGTININVTPGVAQINKLYGLPLVK